MEKDHLRILLVGNGGREHALAWKLSQSPRGKHKSTGLPDLFLTFTTV